MTPEENKYLVRRYYEEVANTGNVSNLADFISPDYVEVHDNVRYEIGIDGARDHVLGVRNTFPDLHLEIEQQIAEGDWVVTVATVRGTHEGVWLGMTPTNRSVEMTTVNVDRVVDGRIVEHGGAVNMLHSFLEIGAVQVANPVGDP
ncbi:MAG: ester cyclase [Xanthomonadales bacterium]|nr:ester cyclase [Xanthomonadales bacterium]